MGFLEIGFMRGRFIFIEVHISMQCFVSMYLGVTQAAQLFSMVDQ
jgi:hypothetical protein